MRKYFGTALLLVTFAGGCSKPPLANQPSPLNVEMRRYERVIPGCGDIEKREQPCFSFQVVYPEVTGAGLEETKTRLNAQVRALLQPPGSPEGFENEATALVEKYASREKPLDEEPAWFVRRIAETVHSTAASWSVRVERTEFLGGGSAVSTYECLNLNPASGAEIRLQDLLEKGGLEELRALAESRFRAERKIPAGGKLSESGYVFAEDRFELPPRFLIGKQGLVFIYSPHEISPEAGGPTYLTLPWAEAGPLLKREAGVVPKI